eukprot:5812826-Prymnesium_polylepis.2
MVKKPWAREDVRLAAEAEVARRRRPCCSSSSTCGRTPRRAADHTSASHLGVARIGRSSTGEARTLSRSGEVRAWDGVGARGLRMGPGGGAP